MRLVVDTSIVFSFFNKDPFLLEFIMSNNLNLISPFELADELNRLRDRVCKYAKISSSEFNELKKVLLEIITLHDVGPGLLSKAESLISHKNDAPFLALALKLDIPIWSNDKHFKEQSAVKVYTVSELKDLLG